MLMYRIIFSICFVVSFLLGVYRAYCFGRDIDDISSATYNAIMMALCFFDAYICYDNLKGIKD